MASSNSSQNIQYSLEFSEGGKMKVGKEEERIERNRWETPK